MIENITRLRKNPITYKITVDITALSLLFVSGFIVSETLLPSIISAYVSPFTIFCAIYALLACGIVLAHTQHIAHTPHKTNAIIFACSLIIFGACVGVASFRFGLLFTLLATLLCTSIYAMIYSVVREEIAR